MRTEETDGHVDAVDLRGEICGHLRKAVGQLW